MAEITAGVENVQRPTTQWFTGIENVVRDVTEITAGVENVVRTVWASGGGENRVELVFTGEEIWFDGYDVVNFLLNTSEDLSEVEETGRATLEWAGEIAGYAQEFTSYGAWCRVEGDEEHFYLCYWWDMPYVVALKFPVVN